MQGLSAIVATFNRRAELVRLFESLKLNPLENFEVIVVDQNDDDLILDVIKDYQSAFRIKHLKLAEKHHSVARNYGVQHSVYDHICFPDDDCWYDDQALVQINSFLKGKCEFDLVIARWKQNPSFRLLSTEVSKKQLFSFRLPMAINSNTLFLKKESFLKIGGFDETFGIGGYIGAADETAMIFKLAKCGGRIFYNHELLINHPYRTIQNLGNQNIRKRERGTGLIYAKFKVPLFVLVRGLLSPLLRAVFSGRLSLFKKNMSVMIGRYEGFFYHFTR